MFTVLNDVFFRSFIIFFYKSMTFDIFMTVSAHVRVRMYTLYIYYIYKLCINSYITGKFHIACNSTFLRQY